MIRSSNENSLVSLEGLITPIRAGGCSYSWYNLVLVQWDLKSLGGCLDICQVLTPKGHGQLIIMLQYYNNN